MVQNNVTGNASFSNLDEILEGAMRLEARDENSRLVQISANDDGAGFIDPVAEAFATDVDDMVDEIRFNPSSNLTEEAQQIINSPLATRLGAGVIADLRAAVQLQEQKKDNGPEGLRGDAVWEEVKEKKEKEARRIATDDEVADAMQNSSQQQAQQQRAEDWKNSDHTYAGQKMSATEWLQMMSWFRSPENQALWEDAMMAETGQSRDKVRETGAKMTRFYELMEKQSNGEKLTPEEQEEFNRLNNDKNVRKGIETQQKIHENQMNFSSVSEANNVNLDGSIQGSFARRAELYDDVAPVGGELVTSRNSTRSVASEMETRDGPADTPVLSASFNKAAIGGESAKPSALEARPDPKIAVATVDTNLAMM